MIHRILVGLLLLAIASAVALRGQDTEGKTPASSASRDADKTIFERIAEKRADSAFAQLFRSTPPEIQTVTWMAGTWDMTWKIHATPTMPESVVTIPVVSWFVMDGTWLRVPLSYPGGAQEDIYLTFDPFQKVWVSAGLGNPATRWVFESKGWDGDRLVFSGPPVRLAGEPVELRHTWVKKSENEWTILKEEKLPSGRWVPLGEFRFVRRS